MLFFEVNHMNKVTQEGTVSSMTLSADNRIKALEHEILVLRKRQIFDRVEITRKAPVWKGKEPMGKESQPVTSSSRIPVESQEPLIHAAPSHITPSQAVPPQPVLSQNEQSQPVPPVRIVQERENTPPPVTEKEPPVHPFAGLPESNYVSPSVRNFAAPVDKNINKEKEPAYKTVAPIQNPKVTDAIYKRSMKSPSVTISPKELLSLSPEIQQKMRDAVMPKRVLTSNESATVATHYNSEVPLSFAEEDIDSGPVKTDNGILSPAQIISQDRTPPPSAIIIPDPYKTYLNSLGPGITPDVLTVAKESHALRSLTMLVDNQTHIESIINPGSQIIAMSDAVCHDLGLHYDP